jgi:hypothetical protein
MTLPHTTKKQFEILYLIYRFRFINRQQIQTILNHKNHRRIHDWLTDLGDKNSIGRIYSKKMPENTKPAVYYLGKNGRKILKQYFLTEFAGDQTQRDASIAQLAKTYKDSQRTEVFRSSCLALVDCFIAVTKYYDEQQGYDMLFSSRTECATYSLIKKFDAYLSVRKKKGKKKHFVFVYLTHRTPRRFTRYRIVEIIKFLDQEWGYETDQPYPTILVISSNALIRNYAKKVFETKLEYYGNPELTIRLTTLYEFKAHGLDGSIWRQPKVEEY